MSKLYFFFYSALLLICIVFSGLGKISLETQLLISLVFILLIGIPHGAIDHLLVKQEGIKNPLKFYIFYLGLLFINLVLWFTLPLIGLITFLLISAYHFGQSQLSPYELLNPLLKRILYSIWGIAILTGLVYYNLDEANMIIQQSNDFSSFLNIPDKGIIKSLLIGSSIGTILLLFYFYITNKISLEQLMTEILFFGLIQVCFFLLPILIGFTLYFIVLHSFKVLIEEFEYLKGIKTNLGLNNFILQLMPYTLLSIFGGLFLYYLNVSGYLMMSGAFILLLLISSITLPHSIVMEGFYHKHPDD